MQLVMRLEPLPSREPKNLMHETFPCTEIHELVNFASLRLHRNARQSGHVIPESRL
jgi:hypothetical protein